MESPSVRNVLLWLRAIALAGQLLTLAIGSWLFGAALPLRSLLLVTLSYGVWHIGLLLRLRRSAAQGQFALGPNLLLGEIGIDLLAVSALLYLAGGWTNPFTPVLLVPLAFAAAVLPWRRALLLTGFALMSYAALVRWHLPMPSANERFGGDFNLHVLGMWASFVVSALVLVGTVALVRAALERQRLALTHEREARLRDEQLVGIGALAASAAHELGTPLNTARLIAEELEGTLTGDQAEQVGLLAVQLDAASDRLRQLVRGALSDTAAESNSLSTFLDKLLERFAVLRPDVVVQRQGEQLPDFPLRDLRLLGSGLLGVLMNAADAQSTQPGQRRIDVTHALVQKPLPGAQDDREHTQLHLRIRDYGPGMPVHAEVLGLQPVASSDGMGVGWVISSATFERHGGSASYEAAKPGNCVHVWLPLQQLIAQQRSAASDLHGAANGQGERANGHA